MVTMTVLGLGYFTWAMFLTFAIRARRGAWFLWSAVYLALAVASVVLINQPDSNDMALFFPLPWIVAWVGGIAHSAAIGKDFTHRIHHLHDPDLIAARQRIARRAEGRHLAASDPILAQELGVGRPDLPGADDYGLIDVNNAAPRALCQLPGITPELAARIDEARQIIGSFTSAEDLCVTANLPPDLTDDLKEHAVFL